MGDTSAWDILTVISGYDTCAVFRDMTPTELLIIILLIDPHAGWLRWVLRFYVV